MDRQIFYQITEVFRLRSTPRSLIETLRFTILREKLDSLYLQLHTVHSVEVATPSQTAYRSPNVGTVGKWYEKALWWGVGNLEVGFEKHIAGGDASKSNIWHVM